MFERFSDRAWCVVALAEDEARSLQHDYIGTEHILLGLIREGGGVAVRVLRDLGIDLGALGEEVRTLVGRGESAFPGHIQFTSAAKKTLELSQREAGQLGHDNIGTEHLLLGLVRQGQGVAAQVLIQRGADLDTVRTKAAEVRSAQQRRQAPPEAIENSEISVQLRMIGLRLAAIEAKVGSEGPTSYQELRGLAQALAQIRRGREAANDEQDSRGTVNLRYLKKAMQARQRAVERGLFDDPPAASGLYGIPGAVATIPAVPFTPFTHERVLLHGSKQLAIARGETAYLPSRRRCRLAAGTRKGLLGLSET